MHGFNCPCGGTQKLNCSSCGGSGRKYETESRGRNRYNPAYDRYEWVLEPESVSKSCSHCGGSGKVPCLYQSFESPKYNDSVPISPKSEKTSAAQEPPKHKAPSTAVSKIPEGTITGFCKLPLNIYVEDMSTIFYTSSGAISKEEQEPGINPISFEDLLEKFMDELGRFTLKYKVGKYLFKAVSIHNNSVIFFSHIEVKEDENTTLDINLSLPPLFGVF